MIAYMILRLYMLLMVVLAGQGTGWAQQVLKLKKPLVYYTMSTSAAVFATGYIMERAVTPLAPQQLVFNRASLHTFDRKVTYNYSRPARVASDIVVSTVAVLPALISLHKEIRKEYLTYNMVYLQVLLATVGEVNIIKSIVKKNRPFLYNPNAPETDKLSPDAIQSFPSGHTAITAAACFYTAYTFHLYYPESKYKPFVWVGAAILPVITGYLRYKGGKHFVSDIAAGYALGAANGILFPLVFKIGQPRKKK